MGLCQSLYDEDEIKRQEDKKRLARELREFQQQLRTQQCHSELDIMGRGMSRSSQNHSHQGSVYKTVRIPS
jgi:hypothetical protein